MPRGPRIVLPCLPHHIVHRGHNRQVVFTGAGEYRYYLRNLGEGKEQLGCKVYAYCLMSNHVHLVIDPGEDVRALGLLMKQVASRQTRLANATGGRSGTLWEGRYKSSPIAADDYLQACCRYVEMNPVRAGILDDPIRYRWSSHAQRAGASSAGWLDPDPWYEGLAGDPAERARRYREWVQASSVRAGQWNLFKDALRLGRLRGNPGLARAIALGREPRPGLQALGTGPGA